MKSRTLAKVVAVAAVSYYLVHLIEEVPDEPLVGPVNRLAAVFFFCGLAAEDIKGHQWKDLGRNLGTISWTLLPVRLHQLGR